MADDTSRETDPHPGDGHASDHLGAARPTRTPPTIDLEASHVETERVEPEMPDESTPEMPGGDGLAAPKPSHRGTALIALIAGALAGLVVSGAGWFVTRHNANAIDTGTIATLETLGARLNRLEEAPVRPAPPNPAFVARLDAMDKTVMELRDQIGALQTKGDSLGQTVDTLKAMPREVPAPAAPAPAAAPPQAAATAEPSSDDAHQTEQRIAQVDTSLKALADDIGKLRDAQATLEQRQTNAAETAASDTAKAVQEVAKTAQAGDPPVRGAVAALALDLAVRQGAPFATELALVRKAGVDEAALKPLQPFADKGVPDPATLSRNLQALTPPPAVASPTERAVNGGWFERLEASAARLIKLRRVDSADNDVDTEGIARAAQLARRGDVAAASREIATLSGPARAQYQPWLDAVAARDAALAASRRIAADAIAALSKSSAP
jgi:hypothetical protein